MHKIKTSKGINSPPLHATILNEKGLFIFHIIFNTSNHMTDFFSLILQDLEDNGDKMVSKQDLIF